MRLKKEESVYYKIKYLILKVGIIENLVSLSFFAFVLKGRMCYFQKKNAAKGTIMEFNSLVWIRNRYIYSGSISWKTTDITYGESKMLSTLAGHQ